MAKDAGWKHFRKGGECKLCGSVAGRRKGDKVSAGCSYSTKNSQLFYCWRKRKIYFLDNQGRVVEEGLPKWSEENCLLCKGLCLSLVENPKQRWCRTKKVTYFVKGNGSVVCRSLGIG